MSSFPPKRQRVEEKEFHEAVDRAIEQMRSRDPRREVSTNIFPSSSMESNEEVQLLDSSREGTPSDVASYPSSPAPAPLAPAAPDRLKMETLGLLALEPVLFLARLTELKRIVPGEYLNGSNHKLIFKPCQEISHINSIMRSRKYSEAILDLRSYRDRGGQLNQQQLDFMTRYIVCVVDKELTDSYSQQLSQMPQWDQPNNKRFIPLGNQEPLCKSCGANHISTYECTKLKDNGPLNVNYLEHCLTWNSPADNFLYIGSSQTLFLSPGSTKLVRNYGLIEWGSTWYPLCEEDRVEEQASYHATLGKKLHDRISALPTGKHPHLLIEFFPSAAHPNSLPIHHLIGFMRELHLIQGKYSGALVMILVPVPPPVGSTELQYMEHKKELQKPVKLAKFLGEVF
jgi:hypothetical protein